MAILSMLLAVSEPTGMWETIIKAFEGALGNYILAILLLTVIIRIIWAPIDLLNRRQNAKMMASQAKMQPELDKLTKKYEGNPQLLNQKKNELYKKYNKGSMGGCLFMLVFMGLNLALFLTLWTGINTMSSFKIYENYSNLKNDYVNCLVLADEYMETNPTAEENIFRDLTGLKFVISGQGEEKVISLYREETQILAPIAYRTDFSIADDEATEDVNEAVTSNSYIKGLIEKYITTETPIVLVEEVKNEETGEVITAGLTFPAAFQSVAMDVVEAKYVQTQDKFLWIENIWIADSPLQNSVFDYNSFVKSVGAGNIDKDEEVIYNAFMTQLRTDKGRANGYFILALLCVGVSFLTMYLSTRRKKGEPKVQGGKAMQIIMPIIVGVFALFYSSVFALYMVTGQIISALLMPLQNLILRKWNDHDDKKKEDKVEVVEYSRKF